MFTRLMLSDSLEDFQIMASPEDLQYLADYKAWFTEINGDTRMGIVGLARELSSASAISRSDSPNGALPISVAEATQQKLKA